MTCPFCTMPENKERIIIENKLAMAFLTTEPVAEWHILIIPKRCVSKVTELKRKWIINNKG